MICDFTQRWKRKKAVYQPLREYFNSRDFEIEEIGDVIAKEFVITNHYTNTYPVARKRFGLFEKGNLVGVAVYSHPMSEKVITNVFGCEKASDGLELGRLVLLDAVLANAESFFVAECHRRLKKDFVGVVSFSDDLPKYSADGKKTFVGHLGIVYQALGATFLNRSSPVRQFILPDGSNLSKRTISKIRNGEVGWQYSSRILQNFGADECPAVDRKRKEWLEFWLKSLTKRFQHPGNLRYAWSFNKKIILKSLPYPKIRFREVQESLF